MKFFVLLATCLFARLTAHSQNQLPFFHGIIMDSSGTTIPGAGLFFISNNDTTLIISKENGEFSIDQPKHLPFLLIVLAPGYERWEHYVEGGKSLPSKIILKSSIKTLKEVVISGKAPPAILKGDTMEFNVSQYKLREDDAVADVLSRLPGASVDKDGNLIMMGEKVSGVMINGQEYLFSSLKELARILPADVIDKIQLIDDYGVASRLGGRKNQDPIKLLNLKTKSNIAKMHSGELVLGIGNEERYFTSINTSYFTPKHQLFASFTNNSIYMLPYDNTTTIISGLYRYTVSDKLKLGIGVEDNRASFTQRSKSNQKMLTSEGILVNNIEDNLYSSKNKYRLKFDAEYTPGKYDHIFVKVNSESLNSYSRDTIQNIQSGIQRLDQFVQKKNSNPTDDLYGSINAIHSFRKAGRLLNVRFNMDIKDAKNDQDAINKITYYDKDGIFLQDSTLRQQNANHVKGKAYSAMVSYIEPINPSSGFELKYNYDYNVSDNTQSTKIGGPDGKFTIVDSLSRSFSFLTSRQNVELNFQSNIRGKFEYELGGRIQFYKLKIANNPNGINFFPVLHIDYKPDKNSQFSLVYKGASVIPSYEQMQSVPDTRNTQFPIIGNPYLQPQIDNTVELNFKRSKRNIFYLKFAAISYNNKIITNIISVTDAYYALKQETHYQNANGAYSVVYDYGWTIPFGKKRNNISLEGSIGQNNDIVFVNSQKNISKNFTLTQAVRAKYYFKNLDIGQDISYMQTHNVYRPSNSNKSVFQTWMLYNYSNLYFTKTLSFTVFLMKQFNIGYYSNEQVNPFSVDANIKKIWFNRKLVCRLEGHNLLNVSTGISQNISGNTITTAEETRLGRYFLLTIIYNFNVVKNQ